MREHHKQKSQQRREDLRNIDDKILSACLSSMKQKHEAEFN